MVKLGQAFWDSVKLGDRPVSRQKDDGVPWWAGAGRPLMFMVGLTFGFFILIARLFDLTVLQGRQYRTMSDTNRTRSLIRHAPRGVLYDRVGRALTINEPEYRLISPCGQGECIRRVSREEGDRLIATGELPSGQYIEVDYLRRYPLGEAMSHVLGYTGELSTQELNSEYYTSRNYRAGDRIGRMGAEEALNERLRGRDGAELVEIDAQGKILRSLGRQEEIPGEDIRLSLDAGLSAAAARSFPSGQKGAVVVSRPATGEILALYSSPGFSPESFTLGMTQSEYERIANNADLPMFNRAIGGVYPPGSTFKIVSAFAALEERAVTPSWTVEDTGVITIGPFQFPNWYFLQYGKTDGSVNLVKALMRSNDIYFYKAGEALGITKLADWAKRVGIGRPLGIELSGEAGGLMPDPAWKKTRFDTDADRQAHNDEWYLGDTYHVSIGQGYLLTTPLAVNTWTNIIASGGKKCRPTILRSGSARTQRENCPDFGLSEQSIDTITEGMRDACTQGGTGWPLFEFKVARSQSADNSLTAAPESSISAVAAAQSPAVRIPVACKTGTAEYGDQKNRTHAWFTAFAPVPEKFIPDAVRADENYLDGPPEISVTVLVEEAGEGSTVAAPVAKNIFEEWFSR